MSEQEKQIAAYTSEQINKLTPEQRQRIGDIAYGMAAANELNRNTENKEENTSD